MTEMIRFDNVSKIYKNEVGALKNLSLEVGRGEFVFLVGESGAGKSTMINLLLKESNPTSGRIYFDGCEITQLSNRRTPYHKRHIGIVYQDFKLLNHKTVYENVAFGMEVVGASRKEIQRQVPAILSLVNLSRKSTRYPHELSGGEQQRVSIARALVNNPKLLIADEPTGNLDPTTSIELMEYFIHICNKGTTIIMSTHDHTIVDRYRFRVVRLSEGELVSDIRRRGEGHEAI
ncbi:cell division ATP-binding protein FtsE [Gottschalkiaceae bacterium SANA]|nr:cell division ATP-binding protein FtsE [Gottschalkiaceae bacterium SANA]